LLATRSARVSAKRSRSATQRVAKHPAKGRPRQNLRPSVTGSAGSETSAEPWEECQRGAFL